MASKGPRSRLDHESRARRQKVLEVPREPPRPKSHWDHVLEEMIWLSKDFESERKWKISQAKKVAVRASKGFLDQTTRGEKKVKEEELRLRKIAANISKDVKKFWIKIEKLVLYKHQLELEEQKKKALDKQLSILLGQTERYSTMLAENLGDLPLASERVPGQSSCSRAYQNKDGMQLDETGIQPYTGADDDNADEDFSIQSDDESEDKEDTIEADEALISEEERRDELEALKNEIDLPLEELLKRYSNVNVSKEGISSNDDGTNDRVVKMEMDPVSDFVEQVGRTVGCKLNVDDMKVAGDFLVSSVKDERKAVLSGNVLQFRGTDVAQLAHAGLPNQVKYEGPRVHDGESFSNIFGDELDDKDYDVPIGEERDDEVTLEEEEELAKSDANDPRNEIMLLQKESELPIEELLARYKKERETDEDESSETEFASCEEEPNYSVVSAMASDNEGEVISETARNQEVDLLSEKHMLISDGRFDGKTDERESEKIIADAAEAARSAQPTGNTFSTTKVRTKFPFLLKHSLREYQHIGLDWLVTMYEKRLNGILADEMGLGKTIMTIALLAHLACEKGIWGPHLIVVPTSVMLNWETEFLKWCPAFKILTYFGSAKERKFKRQGWMKLNSFHVCITTYRLVIQDSKAFKRKKWKYLILDEAHLIKNWKSQRWQTLLNFNSKRRILLTGTPLQNDLMELWSLMHFLMPHIFQSHQEFKGWFSNPVSVMVEGQEKVNKEVVDRLHNVLRPFILRRLKRDVEKQLPKKYEHVIYCNLSRRQRNLYEDFISSSETQATLANANFFGMISVIMQLRKVCNHPDLFEGRPIISSFDMVGIDLQLSSAVCGLLCAGPFSTVDLVGLSMIFTHLDLNMTSWEDEEVALIATPSCLIKEVNGQELSSKRSYPLGFESNKRCHGTNFFEGIRRTLFEERIKQARERATSIAWWNSLQCRKKPMYGTNLRELVTVRHPVYDIHHQARNPSCYMSFSSKLAELVLSPVDWLHQMIHLVETFMFAIPAARAPSPVCWCSKKGSSLILEPIFKQEYASSLCPLLSPIRPAIVRRQVYFPDRRLIQFDCGKLQELAILLRRLKSEGHRALIFTQMTKMLDILEAFINLYGYTYMRLDGSTQPEERQTLMQRFNTNPKYFLFILSTRSGGVGINLVGADTVIFYDSDWNPAMDQQAQDRCHRIGQTREVHIYRLVSLSTIEENILKKANQKRALDELVIQSGSYNTEFFKKLDPMELFSGCRTVTVSKKHDVLSNADVEAVLKHVEDEDDYMALKRVEEEEAVDNQEFTEEAQGRLEEDELVNEEDLEVDENISHIQSVSPADKVENGAPVGNTYLKEGRALMFTSGEEDLEMLDDVKQMAAAAAAAGQASSSFENHLRPIDRYAMQFLDLWDPIVDKSDIESQVNIPEAEWDIERIEKFKEDLEAEADDDDEPLLYEQWDTDFATEAYRQHVEAFAHQQLMEELEYEAKQNEERENERQKLKRKERSVDMKTKSKKKLKKAKFKSLKKETLASDTELHEPQMEMIPFDEVVVSTGEKPPSPTNKKRKKLPTLSEDEKQRKKSPKKLKKADGDNLMILPDSENMQVAENKEVKFNEVVRSPDVKPPNKNKMVGKISITPMPLKRILVIKPEKVKRKGNFRSKDFMPPPDSWSSQEDAILCAIVHEYGDVWSLASDTLYSVTAGGFYRGRFRCPVHCLERFRELFLRCISSPAENVNSEKQAPVAAKALLKVTEDHVRVLLDIACEMPNNELLLQKHFTAVLSAVWKARSRHDLSSTAASRAMQYPGHVHSSLPSVSTGLKRFAKPTRCSVASSPQSSKLVAMLLDATQKLQELPTIAATNQGLHQGLPFIALPEQRTPESLAEAEITIEFLDDIDECEPPLPSKICLSVSEPTSSQPMDIPNYELLKDCSRQSADFRYRVAWKACCEGESARWAASAFESMESIAPKQNSKFSSTGKQKTVTDGTKASKSKTSRTIDLNQCAPRETVSTINENIFSGSSDALCPVSLPVPEFYEVPDEDVTDDGPPETSDFFEMFPDEYDPEIISGLEDFQELPPLTDIL